MPTSMIAMGTRMRRKHGSLEFMRGGAKRARAPGRKNCRSLGAKPNRTWAGAGSYERAIPPPNGPKGVAELLYGPSVSVWEPALAYRFGPASCRMAAATAPAAASTWGRGACGESWTLGSSPSRAILRGSPRFRGCFGLGEVRGHPLLRRRERLGPWRRQARTGTVIRPARGGQGRLFEAEGHQSFSRRFTSAPSFSPRAVVVTILPLWSRRNIAGMPVIAYCFA